MPEAPQHARVARRARGLCARPYALPSLLLGSKARSDKLSYVQGIYVMCLGCEGLLLSKRGMLVSWQLHSASRIVYVKHELPSAKIRMEDCDRLGRAYACLQ